MSDEKAHCVIVYADDPAKAHDGAGWYYYDENYPDEGSIGAFSTANAAQKDAEKNDYLVVKIICPI